MSMASPHTVAGAAVTPLQTLLVAEARTTLGLRHLMALVVVTGMGPLLAIWLPMFPESVLRFFQRAFALPGWSEIVFANAVTGLFFFIYWLGVFDALAVYVLPYEERTLDLLLSKPVSRRRYMLMRLAPVVAIMVVIGTVAGLVCWLAMRTVSLHYAPAAFFGATAATIAWTVLLVAIVNLLVLNVRDSFSAAVFAFVPMFLAILPSMIFMYRPDLLEPVPALKDGLVFPMNLVWHPDIAAQYGPFIAAALLALACLAASLAGTVLERRDVT
jgi:hypothetical protein